MVTDNKQVNGERFAFSADIKKLMGLIINTFYSNKDVFLREVISNSSDAIDKIRFKSLTDSTVLGDEKDFKIQLIPNQEAKTLTIRDNGIGMTKEEMIKNLGTIATSGTKTFMDAIKAGADIQMIGQFGVGFYSVFLVSDKVQVRSKSNDDVQHVWESTAGGEFDIYDDSKNPNQLKRGTEIVMHLKDDQLEYLEERRLKEIVRKHSEFVAPPISIWTSKEVEEEVTDDDAEEEPKVEEIDTEAKDAKDETKSEKSSKEEKEGDKETKDGEDAEKKVVEKKEKKKKKVTVMKNEWEQINTQQSILFMPKKEVTDEQYKKFYKSISNDWEEPLAWKHFKVEGNIEFTGIVYIPKSAPFDLYNSSKKNNNIKLYVRRVFIHDDAKELCPDYLSFVKGVVDSEEMPLNISRETLQKNKILKIIRKNIVKKTLELIEEICEDEEKFKGFYKNFAKNIKYGVHEDSANRSRLAGFLRFHTSKSEKEPKTLKDYIAGMKEEQKDIYYIAGESMQAVKKLPFLERLNEKGLEVLFLTDPIDEYFTQQMTEFEGKKLVSITKEGLELPMSEEEKKSFEEVKAKFEPFCKRVKEILGNRVEKVVVSDRMKSSPCYISTSKYGWSSRMEQIMKNQALRDTTFSSHMVAKKILEVNPKHKIIQEMARRFEEDVNDAACKNLVFLIHDTALLTSGGFTLENPADFADRIYKLTHLGLGLEDEVDEEMPKLEPAAEGEGEEKAEMEEVD